MMEFMNDVAKEKYSEQPQRFQELIKKDNQYLALHMSICQASQKLI